MKRDIAVIGISGKFPKSTNVQEFWKNLVDEKELVHFFTDEELLSRGIDAKQLNDSSYIKAASFIDTYNTFDYSFFKYTPDEAKLMNPQTRLMHQLVWEGIEDAGLNLDTYNKKAGIFLGANRDLNWSVYATLAEAGNVDAMTKAKITNPNFMASLIAYKMNLRGPCYFIDTACSTSLSTAHLACRSLLLNECGTAIVGGVRLLSHHDNGYLYEPGTIVSEDGSVRSFDASSSGTIFCDGAGVVVLKKLEEAIKDNDHVYAVIKASAMNNDGSAKGGYTMPSVSGQSECIKLAHKIAGVQPTDITYVEAHGTATKIGDPIEIESLNKAFNNDSTHKCAIGTVKSNVGHADEAAGILGLIKTTLSIKNKTIPASLHYNKANPAINFAGGPFYVNTKTTAWNRINNKPLTAGISSFGIGGTNIHMVLQETPIGVQKIATPEASYQIRYSADSLSALENFEKALLAHIHEHPTVNLGALAYTLQVGRKQFGLCKAFEVKTKAELIEKLSDKRIKTKEVKEKQDLIFMFSGQGSQYVGMGKFLYEHFSSFKTTMDDGFATLFQINGIDYKAILFDTADTEKINETKYTQPILFLFEYALAKLFIELGLQPNAMIGHSLGEYVAATISGVFTLEDALQILCKRANLMYTVAKGSMLSISANKETLDKALFANVSIATINSPNSFVVSGTDDDIQKVVNELQAKDIQHVVLKTSHAFHSSMMEAIVAEFETALQKITLQAPTIPFVSNNSGEYITTEEASSASYWAKHIVNTVDFKKGIEFLQQQNNGLFLEIGPGRTLTTFFNQCNTTGDKNVAINTIKHPKETVDERTHFLHLLGQIWQHKFDIDWNAFYQGNIPSKIALPTYCFDTYDFPTKVSIDEQLKSQNINLGAEQPTSTLQVATWKQETKVFETPKNFVGKTYIVFCDESNVNNELIALWKLNDIQVITVKNGAEFKQISETQYQINPTEKSSLEALKQAFAAAGIVVDKVIFSWNNETPEFNFEKDNFEAYNQQFSTVLEFMRTFEINTLENDAHIVLLTNSNAQVTGVDTLKGTNNHTSILLRVLVQEASHIQATHIDVDFDKKVDIDQLHKEIHHTADYYKVAYRNGKRWIPTYENLETDIEVENTSFSSEGVYMITGELGTVEFEFIKHVKETYKSNFFLIGKNILDEAYAEKIAALQAIANGSFAFAKGDVSDLNSLETIVANIEAEHGEINGIIHAARFQSREHFLVSSTTKNSIHNHFSVKVNGLVNLYKIFKNKELGFLKVFSSLSAKLGGVTFGAYATSNALLDEVAIGLFAEKTNVSVFNFDKLGTEDTQISVTDIIENIEKSTAYTSESQFIISRRNLNQFEDRATLNEDNQEARFEINRTQLDTQFTAAKTPTEERIVALFEDLFGQTGIGTEDDFFALGGDSLKGISLVNKINKEFSIKLTLSDFFNNATVNELASLIDNRKWLAEKPTTKNEIFI
ncbi:acyl transferase domain-containing protein [Kordia periserrulae]|uniref:Acyl transferase domain-containing protein n=1 Tax=Kordia periserrulae TaxID=701523 RepID=A0A2T6BZ52_9FLAO|nr:type I polyketide synthase [Kordia periserrulae]PTX61365.1 acyl transferase domain-containing protein [Kordia periserrulae]